MAIDPYKYIINILNSLGLNKNSTTHAKKTHTQVTSSPEAAAVTKPSPPVTPVNNKVIPITVIQQMFYT